MLRLRFLIVAISTLAGASALAQSKPTLEECAVKWHVPFDSELRKSYGVNASRKNTFAQYCLSQREIAKGMDAMYSACILMVDALQIEGRDPWEVHSVRNAVVKLLDSQKRSLPTLLEDEACRKRPVTSECVGKLHAVFEDDEEALLKLYRNVEERTERIKIDRELVESYRPPEDRMKFTYYFPLTNAYRSFHFAASGVIVDETPRDFLAFIKRVGFPDADTDTIYLNSAGGSLRGALRLGEMIREIGLKVGISSEEPDRTVVPYDLFVVEDTKEGRGRGRCLGACAFAFLGGVERELGSGDLANFGFVDDADALKASGGHAVASTSGTVGRDELLAYVARMGVDPRVVNRAAAASFDRRPLTAAEAQQLRVAFEGQRFQPWQNEHDAGKVVARATSLDGKQRAEVACDEKRRRPTFTYVMKAKQGWSYESCAESVERFRFAGLSVRRVEVGMADTGMDYFFSLPLPKDYSKTLRDPKLDLKFAVLGDAAPAAVRDFYIPGVTTQGYRQALTAVLKDCPLKP